MAKKKSKKSVDGNSCADPKCPFHGELRVRGREFEGRVIRKLPKKITIEFERIVKVRKYDRYKRENTKIHARLPDCKKEEVEEGDKVKIGGCRPLSKTISHVYLKNLDKSKGNKEKEK